MNFVEMVYRINEHQLLRVWSVISSFSRIREIDDPLAQSEILTNAQMLFTAFVFDLEAVDADQTARRAGLGEIAKAAPAGHSWRCLSLGGTASYPLRQRLVSE